jgi:hypothetical protein
MNPVTYESIYPNIAGINVTGSTVQVSWKCPQTGRSMGTSSATMSADASVGGRVQASVKRSLASEVASGASRLLGNLLGGAAGRVMRDAANSAASDLRYKATANVDYTEASQRAAIVAAFASVQPAFYWDESSNRFLGR